MTSIVFSTVPAIPTPNPFQPSNTPSDYLLVCTRSSCFCQSVFDAIVLAYRNMAERNQLDESAVLVAGTILYVSPEVAQLIESGQETPPNRY